MYKDVANDFINNHTVVTYGNLEGTWFNTDIFKFLLSSDITKCVRIDTIRTNTITQATKQHEKSVKHIATGTTQSS